MAEIEKHGQLTQVDENGDVTVMYPHTTTDDITGTLPIEKGGTGYDNRPDAYKNLANILITDETKKDDMNEYIEPGWFYIPFARLPSENCPPITDGNEGVHVYVSKPTDSTISQIWFTRNMDKVYARAFKTNKWTPWHIFSDVFTSASDSENGTRGLVPMPTRGKQNYYLRGDATWSLPLNAIELTNNDYFDTDTQSNTKLNLNNCKAEGFYWRGPTGIDMGHYDSPQDYNNMLPIINLPPDIKAVNEYTSDNPENPVYYYRIEIPAFNLQVIRTGNSNYMQIFTSSSALKKQYRRWYTGSNWSDWEETKTSPMDAIRLGQDYCTRKEREDSSIYYELNLDNIKTEGFYYWYNHDLIEVLSPPVNSAFNLQVIRTGSNNYMQLLTSSSAAKKQYRRWCYGSAWTTWEEVAPIMTGATSSAAGSSGLVPTPNQGDQGKFLRGDGEWVEVLDENNNIVANIDLQSASGTLSIDNGGTGATTSGQSLYNLSHHTPTAGLDLNNLVNITDTGYWYFSLDTLPGNNAPVTDTAGYLFVICGGGSNKKQIWMNQGNKNTHQDIYVRTQGGNGWNPWVKIKNRRVALVGSDDENQTGWHKVASGTLSGDTSASLIFMVHDTIDHSSGILELALRSTNTSFICKKFGWLMFDNINMSDYFINLDESTHKWTMFYEVQPQHEHGRVIFDVIEDSTMNNINLTYELFSNQNKETTTPYTFSSIFSSNFMKDSLFRTLSDSVVGNNIDLNDFKNNNNYGYYAVDLHNPKINCPSTNPGMLFVYPGNINEENYVQQFYVEINNGDNIYSRHYKDGEWSSWVALKNEYDVATTSKNGLMSKDDKSKLDKLYSPEGAYSTNANIPTHSIITGRAKVDSDYSFATGCDIQHDINFIHEKSEYSSIIGDYNAIMTNAPYSFIHGDHNTINENANHSYIFGHGNSTSNNVTYTMLIGNQNNIRNTNNSTTSNGNNTLIMGYQNIITATTINSLIVGTFNKTDTHGHGINAQLCSGTHLMTGGCLAGGLTIGAYNNNPGNIDSYFIIGNGSSVANTTTRNNALRVNKDGYIYAGRATVTTGADYAEFIKEWYDGNPNNEDRVGYMVTIGSDGYLHKANYGDYIIGITSGNPSIVGNGDEDYYWKYERDKFNRIIYEDVEEVEETVDDDGNAIFINTGKMIKVPKVSSNYDPSLQSQYIERKDRPEWDYVGMRGIVPVRDDGTCEAGGFCKCGTDGIATKAETRGFDTFYVIERIDGETVSVEVR